MSNIKAALMLVVVAQVVAFQLGCGAASDPRSRIIELNSSNIIRMRSCYQIYSLINRKPPKDEKSFLDFFQNDPAAAGRLKRIGVEAANFEEILTSERDGQPFVVRWGVGGDGDEALIFESEGVDGKRMVAFHKPRELEEEEYQGYLNGTLKP